MSDEDKNKECPVCVRCGLRITEPKDGIRLTHGDPNKFACRECFDELSQEIEIVAEYD